MRAARTWGSSVMRPGNNPGTERATERGAGPWVSSKSARNFPAGCREPGRCSVPGVNTATMGRSAEGEHDMAKYLLLKHYRGAPAPVNNVPMDQWTPEEVSAHIKFMQVFSARLEGNGEWVDGQALSPEGMWVRYDG